MFTVVYSARRSSIGGLSTLRSKGWIDARIQTAGIVINMRPSSGDDRSNSVNEVSAELPSPNDV